MLILLHMYVCIYIYRSSNVYTYIACTRAGRLRNVSTDVKKTSRNSSSSRERVVSRTGERIQLTAGWFHFGIRDAVCSRCEHVLDHEILGLQNSR